MPANLTIVTLIDQEGDPFPFVLPGTGYSDVAAYRNACAEAKRLIERGELWPTGGLAGLRLGTVEERPS